MQIRQKAITSSVRPEQSGERGRIIFYLSTLVLLLFQDQLTYSFTIMLDPAGDARQTGRIIEDSFERAIAYDIAKGLKDAIEKNKKNTCILTRSPGEVVAPLQNAQFANKLPIQLYVSINCFHNPHRRSLDLYYFTYHESHVSQVRAYHPLPLDKAYVPSREKSKQMVLSISSFLKQNYGHIIQVNGPYGIPCAPLVGIIAPKLCIELSLSKKTDWQSLIAPIVKAFEKSLT